MATAFKGAKTRTVEAVVSVLFFALAVLVMIEGVRLGSGWDHQGPQAGFFPFWLAVLLAVGAVATFLQGVRMRGEQHFIESRQELVDLMQVSVPLALTVISIPWAGIYIATWLYVWFFAWWYGRFRWWSALLGSLAFAVALYFTLARGLKISMPSSMFYEKGILPF